MKKTSKMSISDYDPALIDCLTKHALAYLILGILPKLGSKKPRGWVSVPDMVNELKQSEELGEVKSLRSSVHYFCKRLYLNFKAIDRDKSERPRYYRINDKGRLHLNELQGKIEGKR